MEAHLANFRRQVKEVIFNAPKLSDFGVNIGGDAHYFEDTMSENKVKEGLDSLKDVDVIHALKYLLAVMSKGKFIVYCVCVL